MNIVCCFIKKEFFSEHKDYKKILDAGNVEKQTHRTHVCIKIETNNNNFYIPLRNNLGLDVRKFGRIGHAVATAKRPNAGLDYRHALVVNDNKYIEVPKCQRIPNSQYQKLVEDFTLIEKEFNDYLDGFIKVAKKGRINKEALYRDSSLINFFKELDIFQKKEKDQFYSKENIEYLTEIIRKHESGESIAKEHDLIEV